MPSRSIDRVNQPGGVEDAGDVSSQDTRLRLEDGALRLFRAKGYSGSSIREIASEGGVAVATMFWHFPNKAAILESLLHRGVDEVQRTLDAAAVGAESPAERLAASVHALVQFHCDKSMLSFVAESELRSLEEPASSDIRAKRMRVQHMFRDCVREGVARGDFNCAEPDTTAIAILTMCTAVATWYRPGGRLTANTLADHYVGLAFRLVGCDR